MRYHLLAIFLLILLLPSVNAIQGIEVTRYNFSNEKTVLKQDDFKLSYIKEETANNLESLDMYILDEQTYFDTEKETVCNPYEIINKTVQVIPNCTEQTIMVEKVAEIWKPFDPIGYKVKSFELIENTDNCLTDCYAIILLNDKDYIKILGKKDVKIGENNIDWKIDVFGTKPNWAWWNSSWSNCKNITMTYTENKQQEPVSVNITGLTGNVTKELRIVNAGCGDDGTAQKLKFIETDQSSYAFIVFSFTNTTPATEVWSAYYNYSGIEQDPSLIGVKNNAFWTRTYNGTVLPNNDGWGDATGTSNPSIVSDKGFQRLKMVDTSAVASSYYSIGWSPSATDHTIETAVRILGTSDAGGGEILAFVQANGEYISLDANSTHLFHSTGRCSGFAGGSVNNDTYAVLRAVHTLGNTDIYINNVLKGSCNPTNTALSGNIHFGSQSGARTSQYLMTYFAFSQGIASTPILATVGTQQTPPPTTTTTTTIPSQEITVDIIIDSDMITSYYCIDNNTLYGEVINEVSVGVNQSDVLIVSKENCVYGCDNQTQTCKESGYNTYKDYLIGFTLIVVGLLIIKRYLL